MKTDAAAPPSPTSRKPSTQIAVLPASEGDRWDIYRFEGGTPSQITVDEPRLKPADAERAVIGWSVRQAITLPVWVADSGESREMVALELELRGLVKSGDEPAFGLEEVVRENGRTLYAVHLLANLRAKSPVKGAARYDVRLRWFPVEADAIYFWKEAGNWAYGISRQGILLHAQSLRQPELTGESFREVRRAIERFLSERVLVAPPPVIRFFDSAGNETLDEAGRILEATVQRAERRNPQPPKTAIDLPSTSIREWRERHRRAGQLKRTGLVAASILLLIALGAGGLLVHQQSQLAALQAEIDGQSDEVSRLMDIARDWNVIEPAVNPTYYPLDILRDCAAQLPENGTRLTAATISGTEIVLQGEAVNHPAAFQFADNLKNSPALAAYIWEIPQPTLLPNNTASFQMQGLRHSNEESQP